MAEPAAPVGPFGQSLDAAAIDPGPARLYERPFLSKLSLRLRQLSDIEAVSGLGLRLPAPGRATQSADLTLLSISPTELLAVAPFAGLHAWRGRLHDALTERNAAIIDVSSNTTVVRLSGPEAMSLLSRGCPIDLNAPNFASNCCATTKIGKITVTIHRTQDQNCFDLYIGRSLAVALLSWFTSTGRWAGLPPALSG